MAIAYNIRGGEGACCDGFLKSDSDWGKPGCTESWFLALDLEKDALAFEATRAPPSASENWLAEGVWEHTLIFFGGAFMVYLLSGDEWVCLGDGLLGDD